jgi:protocatechuate 3,4-dioxygenase beta subunit
MARPPVHDLQSPERRVSPALEPPHLHPPYRSTVLRAPSQPPVRVPYGPGELARLNAATLLDAARTDARAADLTRQHGGEPIGERMIVEGQILDGVGRPIAGALVEVWQANAAGRYAHAVDEHPAPLDPNFTGCGRTLTDDDGHYRFTTIKPGAYPWQNHPNAWRPAHIHFSVFGRAFTQRLVTQMYFPGDPLFGADPIFNSIRDPKARERMVSTFDWETTTPEWALGYRFDIVLGGRAATPLET